MRDMIPILRARRERRLTRMRRDEAGRRSVLLVLGTALSLVLAAVILVTAIGYADLTRDLPSIDQLPQLLNPPDGLLLQPTRMYDRTGQRVLATFGVADGPRSYMPVSVTEPEHMSGDLSGIVIALVDPSFWQHSGYAINGWRDPSLHPTIAERLVSDLLLYDEQPSIRRALRERILAAQVTAR